MLISGKEVSNKILMQIKEKNIINNKTPKLVIVRVGNDPASVKYTKNKKIAAEKCGVDCEIDVLDEDISLEKFNEYVSNKISTPEVSGVIVQLPIPKTLNLSEIEKVFAMFPNKDVDGLSLSNIGILHGEKVTDKTIIPCTAKGCMDLIHETGISVEGKIALVIGRSNIVGKPVSRLLEQENATVIQCHSRTPKDKLLELGKLADIVIVAIGKPYAYKTSEFPNATVFIDVGINVNENGKLCGDILDDVDVKESESRYITPVPGGVGPMTVANLMYNTSK